MANMYKIGKTATKVTTTEGFGVFQKDHNWFVSIGRFDSPDYQVLRYEDNMKIKRT